MKPCVCACMFIFMFTKHLRFYVPSCKNRRWPDHGAALLSHRDHSADIRESPHKLPDRHWIQLEPSRAFSSTSSPLTLLWDHRGSRGSCPLHPVQRMPCEWWRERKRGAERVGGSLFLISAMKCEGSKSSGMPLHRQRNKVFYFFCLFTTPEPSVIPSLCGTLSDMEFSREPS